MFHTVTLQGPSDVNIGTVMPLILNEYLACKPMVPSAVGDHDFIPVKRLQQSAFQCKFARSRNVAGGPVMWMIATSNVINFSSNLD